MQGTTSNMHTDWAHDFTGLCQLTRETPRLFSGFNCGLLESHPQSDLPADWVVRRFDNDDDEDCIEVYDLLALLCDYSPVYSHWSAGDSDLALFCRSIDTNICSAFIFK
jgi:hypothetical protein